MFQIKFNHETSAFGDGKGIAEVERILRRVCERVKHGELWGKVWDSNNEAIGFYSFDGKIDKKLEEAINDSPTTDD